MYCGSSGYQIQHSLDWRRAKCFTNMLETLGVGFKQTPGDSDGRWRLASVLSSRVTAFKIGKFVSFQQALDCRDSLSGLAIGPEVIAAGGE